MAVFNIEIICRKCSKCEFIELKLREAIRQLEYKYQTKIDYELKINEDLREMNKFALSASQRPVVVVNGNVEFAGRIMTRFLKSKLDSILKGF
ncbi:MAG: hypothetical protein A3K83_00555 [Omnitrophica WOR_2 bacterium RBG_13_44_8b]|nr:MAG: hypothetical protein A3K83_00555 [Omnitrophica WOR_2 bacterium RBG_13_44_8b]